MKRILFVGLCVLGIQGCTTPYQKMGASGGVESTIIDDNVFQVKASVNGYTQKSVATQYAIRKAAEVSQSLGCNYYSAINNTSQSYDQNTSKTNSGLMTE
ncbi:CC0125/CC1285 family lipoprotein, partial [Acinetobacter sp. ESBL14]